MEIVKESTDESAGVWGDLRPNGWREIVESHEAVAERRPAGQLMLSFGVFGDAPAETEVAPQLDERRGVNDPLAGGDTARAGRATEYSRAVVLDISAPDGGKERRALLEDLDGGLGIGQSVVRMGAHRTGSQVPSVRVSLMGTSSAPRLSDYRSAQSITLTRGC